MAVEEMAAACAPLQPFAGRTADDLAESYADLAGAYKECSLRHAALAKAVR